MKYIKKFETHALHLAEKSELEANGIYLSYCANNEGLTFFHPYSLKKMGVGDYLLKDGTTVKGLDGLTDMKNVIAIKVIPEYFLPDGKARYAAIRNGVDSNGNTKTIDSTMQWCNSNIIVNALEQFNKVPCADTDTVNINKHVILGNYRVQGWHDWGRVPVEVSLKNPSLNPYYYTQYNGSDITDDPSAEGNAHVYGNTTYNNLTDWYIYTDPLDDNGNDPNVHTGGSAPIPSPYIGTSGVYTFNGAYYTDKDVFGRTGKNMLSDIDGKSNTSILLADISDTKTHDAALFCSEYTIKDSETEDFANWYAPGKWYLPAIGELVFILSGWGTILDSILAYKNKGGNGTTFDTNSVYWSSTLYSANNACRIDTLNGHVYNNNKNNRYNRVRPFLRLD